MLIYLARHGQTKWNVEGRWQGSTDKPLDDTGVEQANILADRLEKYPIKAVYSSPLKRAADTAEASAKKLGLEVIFHDDLREICLGDWEGLNILDIRKKYPTEFAKWDSDDNAQVGMGVESNYDAQTRGVSALLGICETEKRDTLIVSHGGIINRLICRLLHIPLKNRQGFRIQNTGLCVVECTFIEDEPRFQIVTINDFSHLQTSKTGAGLALTTF